MGHATASCFLHGCIITAKEAWRHGLPETVRGIALEKESERIADLCTGAPALSIPFLRSCRQHRWHSRNMSNSRHMGDAGKQQTASSR